MNVFNTNNSVKTNLLMYYLENCNFDNDPENLKEGFKKKRM